MIRLPSHLPAFALLALLPACGGTPAPTPDTQAPVVTTLSGNTELGTNENPQPTTVTITGKHLQNATVAFGREGAGTNLNINADGTQLTVVAPPDLAGRRPIIVSTPYGKVNAGIYTFRQGTPRPTVYLLALSPTSGPAAGGTTVTFTYDGALNYSPVDQPDFTVPDVYFGTVKATTVTRSGDTITAVSPPGSGYVDVTFRCPIDSCYTFSTTDAVPFHYTP